MFLFLGLIISFFITIQNTEAFDLDVHLINKSIRSEYAEGSDTLNTLFKPNIGFGVELSFDFKKKLRLSLGHELTKHKVINSNLTLSEDEFQVGSSYLALKLKTAKSVFLDLAYRQHNFLISDLTTNANSGTVSAEINLTNLYIYEVGVGLISKASSVSVLTSFSKIHIPEQKVDDKSFVGHGTVVGVRIELKAGLGVHFKYINTALSGEGESIYDERVLGLYQKLRF